MDDWGNFAEWVSAAAAVATFWVADIALMSWRNQLTGASKHKVALEIATAARALKYAFYGARSPLYESSEFPRWYLQQEPSRTNDDEARAYGWLYQRRWRFLWPYLRQLAHLVPKAGAILGDETAGTAEKLVRHTRRLNFFMAQRVKQLRAGEAIVATWSDQKFVALVKSSVDTGTTDDHTDQFSREFEDNFNALLSLLNPHLR